jgi:hypothetical protein
LRHSLVQDRIKVLRNYPDSRGRPVKYRIVIKLFNQIYNRRHKDNSNINNKPIGRKNRGMLIISNVKFQIIVILRKKLIILNL